MNTYRITFSYDENGILRTKRHKISAKKPDEAEEKLRKLFLFEIRIWKTEKI
jgi:hypothetical protein